MFMIKAYEKESMDYTAFQCSTYHRQWNAGINCMEIVLDPVFSECQGGKDRSMDAPMKIVTASNYGPIYIQNENGKTVDCLNQELRASKAPQ